MKDNKSGWQFPKALEIIKCKEGNKEFMKERPARRPFGNTVLICEYPIDDTAAEEPNAKLITWRLAKRAARDFLRVSFMPSAIVSAATDKTAKCSLYYTPETDGLSQSWDRGGAVFCNPPYGREIGKWVQKAFKEARGVSDCFAYPSADGYGIFSRLHLRESGNPLRARAATVHGRRRERRRSSALPFNGSYL